MQQTIVLAIVAFALVAGAIVVFMRFLEDRAQQRRNQDDDDREARNIARWAARQRKQQR